MNRIAINIYLPEMPCGATLPIAGADGIGVSEIGTLVGNGGFWYMGKLRRGIVPIVIGSVSRRLTAHVRK